MNRFELFYKNFEINGLGTIKRWFFIRIFKFYHFILEIYIFLNWCKEINFRLIRYPTVIPLFRTSSNFINGWKYLLTQWRRGDKTHSFHLQLWKEVLETYIYLIAYLLQLCKIKLLYLCSNKYNCVRLICFTRFLV